MSSTQPSFARTRPGPFRSLGKISCQAVHASEASQAVACSDWTRGRGGRKAYIASLHCLAQPQRARSASHTSPMQRPRDVITQKTCLGAHGSVGLACRWQRGSGAKRRPRTGTAGGPTPARRSFVVIHMPGPQWLPGKNHPVRRRRPCRAKWAAGGRGPAMAHRHAPLMGRQMLHQPGF